MQGLELFLSSEKGVKAANEFRQAVEAAATAVERIGASVDKTDRSFDKIGGSASGAVQPVTRLGRGAIEAGDGFRRGAAGAELMDRKVAALGSTSGAVARQIRSFLVVAGGITGIAAGVRAIAGYEDALKILGSIAGATSDELKRLEAAAIETSRATRFTPTETVQGLTELARAGLDATSAVEALKPTADLARVGLISLAESSAIVTKTLAQYALGAEEAGRVADVLAKGANSTNADVSTLARALSKAGSTARVFGIDLEQTVAALGLLANNGVQASISGTGLERILIRLRTPTDEARTALLGLGVAVDDINPERVGLIGALKNLNQANLGVAESTQLVDAEFARLLKQMVDGVGDIERLDQTLRGAVGEAAEQAAAGSQTLAAALAALRSASEEAAIAIGRGGVGDALAGVAKTGADALRILTGDERAFKDAGDAAKVLAAGIKGAAAAAAVLAGLRFADYLGGIAAAAGRSVAAVTALDAVTGTLVVRQGIATRTTLALGAALSANPFGAVATAIGGVVAALALFSGGSTRAEEKAREEAAAVARLRSEYEATYVALQRLRSSGDIEAPRIRTQDFAQQQEAIVELVRKIELLRGAGLERIPVDQVLGIAGISEVGSDVAKIRELVEAYRRGQDEIDKLKAEQERKLAKVGAPLNEFDTGPGARAAEIRRQFAPAIEGFAALSRAAADGLRTLGVEIDSTGQLTYGLADANRVATQGLRDLDSAAKSAGVSIEKLTEVDSISSAVTGLIRERERELEIAQLSTIERKEALLVIEAERRAGQGLNDQERERLRALAEDQEITEVLLDYDKKRADKAEELAQKQRELPRALSDLRRQYEDQLRLATAEGDARAEIQGEILAINDAKAIGLALDSEDFLVLRDIAVETAKANQAQRDRKSEARQDNRRDELLRNLEAEEQAVRLTGEARERYLDTIEAENEARRLGSVLSDKEIRDFVARRQAIRQLARDVDSTRELFRDFGQAAGGQLEQIVFETKNASDAVRDLGRELLRIAFQRSVTNNLTKLFDIAGAAIGNAISPSATTTTANMTGGVIPALTGVIASPTILERGGRRYSVAEGGGVTPEAVFPLARDERGRLGVVGAGGGGATVVQMSFPAVRNSQDARAVRSTLSQRVRRLQAFDSRGRRGMRPIGQ